LQEPSHCTVPEPPITVSVHGKSLKNVYSEVLQSELSFHVVGVGHDVSTGDG
jgi:hypothetical protein